MAKGSFVGLYTFEEISKIYQMESSNLRKMVQYNKFTDKEIKKFGKTWIITEDAVRKHFGHNIDTYFNDIKLNEFKDMKNIHREVESAAVTDLSVKEDLGEVENFEYVEVDPNSVVSSFNFSK